MVKERTLYLLDTDHCILVVKRRQPVAKRIARISKGQVYIPFVAVGELLEGVYEAPRRYFATNMKVARAFLERLPILLPDDGDARRWGELSAQSYRGGLRAADNDLWIAALAVNRRWTVLTANKRHFALIPGVKFEDWTKA